MSAWNTQKKMMLGIGVWTLTSCGIFRPSQNDEKIYGPDYVTNARLEAQRMALLQPELRQGMAFYETCETLAQDLNESVRQRWIQQKADISDGIAKDLIQRNDAKTQTDSIATPTSAPEGSTTDSASPAPDVLTNVQETGVDEADRFRIGRDQIYAASFGKLKVLDRATLQLTGTLDVSSWYSPQFFSQADRLIIVGPSIRDPNATIELKLDSAGASTGGAAPSVPPFPVWGGAVKIAVYQTGVGTVPTLLSESKIKGSYVDSRLVQNQLVLVINDPIETETAPITLEDFADEEWYSDSRARALFAQYYANMSKETAVKIADSTLNGIPCDHVVKRKMADWDADFSKVLTLDTVTPQSPMQNIAVLGQGGEIYMTTDSLFLLKTQVKWFAESWGGWSWHGTPEEKVLIQQIGFDGATGQLNPLADGEVRGRIKDRWALHGMNGGKNLAIATSTGMMWGPAEFPAQNHLYILEQDTAQRLQVVGSVENYGTMEDIRSVRYVDNTAYVVTFRQTDPLFAFDITDPKAPKILSGLKVPGFSTYMHPLAPGRLLGVGFDAFQTGQVQGVQVSLFDTTDPTLMSRLDNKIYGSRGSNSEVTQNHRAFFFDSSSQLIGIPLVELYSSYGEVKFSGAQLLQLNGNTLVDRGRVSHREWIPTYCQARMSFGGNSLDINRLYRVDDRLITLSAYGIKAYSLTDFTVPTVALQFTAPVGECQSTYPMPL